MAQLISVASIAEAIERIRTADHTHDDVALLERALRTSGYVSHDVEAFAVYNPLHGWLEDTCAGGTWSPRVADAVWFPSKRVALDTLKEADFTNLEIGRYFVIRVQ